MKIILSGFIKDNNPLFNARINNNKCLEFNNNGSIFVTVDTGFIGGIALPKEILSKLSIKFVAYESFILANGSKIRLKVFTGRVVVKKKNVETLFIEGDYLIGMELMSSLADELRVDFKNKKVRLIEEMDKEFKTRKK